MTSHSDGRPGGDPTEGGQALLSVLLALMVVTGLVFTASALVVGQIKDSGATRDRESAVHAAEAGAETLLTTLAAAPLQPSTAASGAQCPGSATYHCLPASTVTDREQRTWAMEQFRQAESAGQTTVQQVPGGVAYAIRPVRAGTVTALPYVFGVARIGAGPRSIRVVRLALADRGPQITRGVITNDAMEFNNNISLTGGAHSNTTLVVNGPPLVFQQPVTASTTGVCPAGSCTTSVPPLETSPVVAADLHALGATSTLPWYDLCPGAVVKLWVPGGPCANPVSTVPPGGVVPLADNTWEIRPPSTLGATFYAHEGSLLVTATTGAATFIASRGPGNVTTQGNISLTGGFTGQAITPALVGIGAVADRDLSVDSNHTLGQPGGQSLLLAGEQLKLYNGVVLHGAAVALDNQHRAPEPSTGILVGVNRMDGNAQLVYDGTLRYPGGGDTRIQGWQEL